MSTDPFEEFEFKPLTEGLGFHKPEKNKAEQIKAGVQSSKFASEKLSRSVPNQPPTADPAKPTLTGSKNFSDLPTASESISKLMASLPPSFGAPNLDFLEDAPEKIRPTPTTTNTKEPAQELVRPAGGSLQARGSVEQVSAKMGPSALGSTLSATPALALKAATVNPATQNPFKKTEFQARLDESFAKAFPKTTKSATAAPLKSLDAATGESFDLVAIPASLPAAILDALMVLGVSTLGLVLILMITRVDLVAMLTNAQTDGPTQLHLGLLYVSMLQFYMLISRSFFGATLGEWSFDSQMGTTRDQLKSLYPVQVVWRTLLVSATFFVLPLLSLALKRDLLKPVTGLQIYRRS